MAINCATRYYFYIPYLPYENSFFLCRCSNIVGLLEESRFRMDVRVILLLTVVCCQAKVFLRRGDLLKAAMKQQDFTMVNNVASLLRKVHSNFYAPFFDTVDEKDKKKRKEQEKQRRQKKGSQEEKNTIIIVN
uniref:Pre-mRNA-processing factor 17 n=1 Tax=Lygus hesperus TaxID=30085 RepID=A0A0A9XIE6_LYGHE